MSHETQTTGEAEKKILHERAELLAREPQKMDSAKERMEVVAFVLGNEKYALAAEHVREIDPLRDFTPIPCTPPFVLGLINVRGQILTVIDIRKFFDLPEKGISNLNKVIIMHAPEMELGILADEILGSCWIAIEALQSSLPTLTGIRAEYLRGVTIEESGDRLVVLDAAKILSDERIVVRDEPA